LKSCRLCSPFRGFGTKHDIVSLATKTKDLPQDQDGSLVLFILQAMSKSDKDITFNKYPLPRLTRVGTAGAPPRVTRIDPAAAAA
jgi:hypothetical protein